MKWWKTITIGVVLLGLVTPAGLVYGWGTFRLNQEIAWLKKNHRPTNWDEFYQKYPPTPRDAPECQQLQRAIPLMANELYNQRYTYLLCNYNPNYSYLFFKKQTEKLTTEERKFIVQTLAETREFRHRMYKLLDLPPVTVKNKPENDLLEPEIRAFDQLIDLEKYRYFMACHGRDFSTALNALENNRKAVLISIRMRLGYLPNPYSDICQPDDLINIDEIPVVFLRRLLEYSRQETAAINEFHHRYVDYHNVEAIVLPVTSLVGHSMREYHQEPLPAILAFSFPLNRARRLQMMRTGEPVLFCEKYAVMRQPVFNNSKLARWLLIFCRGKYYYYGESFFNDFITDDNRYPCWIIQDRRVIETGIAAELYRRKYGKLPETLASMVPEFIAAIPLDPFDSRPLNYMRSSDQACRIMSGRKSGCVFDLKPRLARENRSGTAEL